MRVSADTMSVIRELTEQTGASTREIIEAAVDTFRRWYLLEEVNRAYSAIQRDPQLQAAWEREESGRRAIEEARLASEPRLEKTR